MDINRNIFKHIINESKKINKEGNTDAICSIDELPIFDESKGQFVKVNPSDIVDVVEDAMIYMRKRFHHFGSILDTCKTMYVPVYNSKDLPNTMAVDKNRNLWINLNFVYNACDMDKHKVFAILFHEMYHIFADHMARFFNRFQHSEEYYQRLGEWDTIRNISNICMDIEINTSMVADGIVTEDFWEKMAAQYNSKYFGLTWEEIYNKYGMLEYQKYIEMFGQKINATEMKIIEAIEKATKILNDPNATNADKEKARKELQKTLSKLLGYDNDIQTALEKTKDAIGNIGNIKKSIEDVIDNLYEDITNMSKDEYNDLMNNIDKMADEMISKSSEISNQIGKHNKVTEKEIEKMRETLKSSLKQLREDKNMSKETKEDLIDNIKDSIEDITLSDMDKLNAKEERQKRDERKEELRKEELKKKHPLRKLMNVFKNLIRLKDINRVSEDSCTIMEKILEIFDKLTEKKLSEVTENDVKDLKNILSDLKKSFFNDLKALLDDKVIINKDEKDLHKVLDDCFDYIILFIFEQLIDSKLEDKVKLSSLNTAIEKLRKIGSILKTQKKYRASSEFKDGFNKTAEELKMLYRKDKKEFLKKLIDLGVVNGSSIGSFNDEFRKLYSELKK